jgi:DNA polymerase-3 subunit alpha (Gram-positive type)
MHISETEFVIFDTETTGLSPKQGDRMIELGAVKVKGRKIIDTFETFINPRRQLDPGAQLINHITEDMVASAPYSDEVLPRFMEFVGGACLAGHNVKFDLEFVCFELSLMGRKLKDETPAIDTLLMARRFMPHLTSFKLSNVARSFGVTIEDTHRALSDVKLTHSIMNHLLDLAERQKIELFTQLHKDFSVVKPNYKIQPLEQVSFF